MTDILPELVIDADGVEWIAAYGLFMRLVQRNGQGVAYIPVVEKHIRDDKVYPGGLKRDPRKREYTQGGGAVKVKCWRVKRSLKACSVVCPHTEKNRRAIKGGCV